MQNWEWAPALDELREMFSNAKYVADENILITVFLALKLQKPLLVEGEPGCGKTEIAKVLSEAFKTDLIRLQCYEGLDASSTIYEWDYLRQLLKIRMCEGKLSSAELDEEIFSERFLLKRPILNAVLHSGSKPPVLLIDELDRADEEFEGFLLEFLAEWQVTIPEIGTFRAKHRPIVVVTSNRTRELGEGLRRRCLYLYLSYPSPEKELRILELKVPEVGRILAGQIVDFAAKLRRDKSVLKKPGVSETLDWAHALHALRAESLTPSLVKQTLGCLIKEPDTLRLDASFLESMLKP
jgi:MoxR-like ATPase